jgi:hypothetical protein
MYKPIMDAMTIRRVSYHGIVDGELWRGRGLNKDLSINMCLEVRQLTASATSSDRYLNRTIDYSEDR